MIWDTTDFITVFNLITRELRKEKVKDIPNFVFLENNRFINLPQKVFVSGGVEKDFCTNLFYVLERKSNKIRRLSNMPLALTRHSLISLHNKSIMLVGGKNNRSCFIYTIYNDKWDKLNCLNYEREDASLFFFNDKLFCFGGIVNTEMDKNTLIEYSYLDDRRSAYWIALDIAINVPEDTLGDLQRLSGSGVIYSELYKSKVYICGGYNNENSDEVNFIFEFTLNDAKSESISSELIKRTDLHLCSPNWFQESNFILLQNKYYNFDIDGNVHIFSMDMEKFFLQEYNF